MFAIKEELKRRYSAIFTFPILVHDRPQYGRISAALLIFTFGEEALLHDQIPK
ncbi:hypothetical protein HMPREF0454_01179 [Hafnia alvei ATCC 51873]|uniref:Uncharacterized protein n=1 Tax=Hafnia alvei ATCC 51873 TaxID=1002364 RepID=G9Y3P9_HAFAL|nr:hypothetical protein HMPREF0454_01179 [Hafnia alvei ATCC 51873]